MNIKKYWLFVWSAILLPNVALGILNGGGGLLEGNSHNPWTYWEELEQIKYALKPDICTTICCLACCPLLFPCCMLFLKEDFDKREQASLLLKAINKKSRFLLKKALESGADINCIRGGFSLLVWKIHKQQHQEVLFMLQNNARIHGDDWVYDYLENNITNIATIETIDRHTLPDYCIFFHQLYFAALQNPNWHAKLIALHDRLRTKNPYLLKLLSAQGEFEKYPKDITDKLRKANLFPLITIEETMQKSLCKHQSNGLHKTYDCNIYFS